MVLILHCYEVGVGLMSRTDICSSCFLFYILLAVLNQKPPYYVDVEVWGFFKKKQF